MPKKRIAEKIWLQMKENHAGSWGMDIDHWDWVPGVGVIAMLEYYEATDRPEVLEYLRQWVARNQSKAAGSRVINGIAPYAIFPALYRVTGEEAYRDEAVRIAEWLVAEAPRTREQAFEHTVTEQVAFAEQVWADTIFMAVLFLARTATITGHVVFAEEAQRQVLIHLRLLEDPASGVLFHGWNCVTRDHMSAARWTRANGWIAAGVPMILEETAKLVPVDSEVADRYIRLMDGLLSFQREDGLWSTVMDQAEYYPEVSGSAGIGYGLLRAMEGGWLPEEARYEEAADRVLQAVISHVMENGIVAGVSGGTPVMDSIEAYNQIPQYSTLYGQGLSLMLLAQSVRGTL
ncbi:glycoside hydrolase family 88/105 protein [Cohnella lupini]|uniref:Unsaturated rhamnogalacturonyl hydrolase n=1 Tax=Cohnella lupini TaxID=1294267 RepID=A0A3D9I1Q7_9BACL|nr:glycoside hydrolase family 88 protein [Cohnella lupini]RED55697.1 unsaturated rhamnogalacturonyl hydrolase [Cohnella lupini]